MSWQIHINSAPSSSPTKVTLTKLQKSYIYFSLHTIYFSLFLSYRALTDWWRLHFFLWPKRMHFGAWFTSSNIWCLPSIIAETNNLLEPKLIRYLMSIIFLSSPLEPSLKIGTANAICWNSLGLFRNYWNKINILILFFISYF